MFSNKSLKFITIAAGLAFTACTMEPLIDNGGETPEDKGDRIIAVSFAPDTKTALGSDGITPEFVGNETIRVSNGTEYQDCTVETTGNGAVFATKLKGELRAVYPAESGKIDGNVITGIVIPAEQDGSFASANIAEATIPEKATSATFKNQASLFVITPPDGTSYLMVKSLRPVENGVARTGEASAINSEGEAGMIVTNTGFDPKDGKVYLALLPGADIRDIQIDAVSETQGKGSIISFPPSMTDTIAVNSAYTVANNWHEYVTIDGRKWATANVGASSPTEAGRYFAWGDVVGQTWDGSAWSGGGFSSAPEIGNPETLPLQYDAAYANWGGDWRMPTREEFDALEKGEYGSVSSVYGRTYGASDVQMFLPVAGIGEGTTIAIGEDNDWGWYWSSSLYDSERSYGLFFSSEDSAPDWEYRTSGFPVRAIIGDPSPDIKLEDLSQRIEALKGSIQSISILPAYPDGSIIAKDDTLCINCAVTPAEAVTSLQESDFRILLNMAQTVQTKAGNIYVADKFAEFTANPENGTLTIKAVIYSPPTGYSLAAALNVKTGKGGTAASSFTTDFVSVTAITTPSQDPDPQGELVDVDIWKNNGSLGEINWSGNYRFGLDGTDGNNECAATFDAETWDAIKEGVFYAELSGSSPQIRVTTGQLSTIWSEDNISPGNERLTDNGNGTWTLEINFAGDPILDELDEKHLLFTGEGYTVLRLYVKEYREHKDSDSPSEVVVWENKDNIPVPSWGGTFRFSNTEHSSGEEIYAIPMEHWAVIKEGVFRVAVETAENPNIRITTGWWTSAYGGADHNSIDMVEVDENGSKYIEVNIKEDGNLYDNIDAQHLLFTGEAYTVKKIYYFE